MDFLTDENVEPITVGWLRSLGHTVLSVLESLQGSDDIDLLRLAETQKLIIVTYDLDFGEMVYRQRLPHSGVILIRLNDPKPADRLVKLQQRWHLIESRCSDSFIVVHDQKIRIRSALGPT